MSESGIKNLFDITDKKDYMSWFGRIAQKHIDFLICDEKLRPKFAIELDDNSHKNNKNDSFKDALFKAASLKLIRIRAQIDYSEEYIERNININMENSSGMAE